MIEIDKEILCAFCRDQLGMDEGRHCEGSRCGEIEEIYLPEVGISEEPQGCKTFGKLRIGDNIYIIDGGSIMPSMITTTINSLRQMNNSPMAIHYDSESVEIEDRNGKNNGGTY